MKTVSKFSFLLMSLLALSVSGQKPGSEWYLKKPEAKSECIENEEYSGCSDPYEELRLHAAIGTFTAPEYQRLIKETKEGSVRSAMILDSALFRLVSESPDDPRFKKYRSLLSDKTFLVTYFKGHPWDMESETRLGLLKVIPAELREDREVLAAMIHGLNYSKWLDSVYEKLPANIANDPAFWEFVWKTEPKPGYTHIPKKLKARAMTNMGLAASIVKYVDNGFYRSLSQEMRADPELALAFMEAGGGYTSLPQEKSGDLDFIKKLLRSKKISVHEIAQYYDKKLDRDSDFCEQFVKALVDDLANFDDCRNERCQDKYTYRSSQYGHIGPCARADGMWNDEKAVLRIFEYTYQKTRKCHFYRLPDGSLVFKNEIVAKIHEKNPVCKAENRFPQVFDLTKSSAVGMPTQLADVLKQKKDSCSGYSAVNLDDSWALVMQCKTKTGAAYSVLGVHRKGKLEVLDWGSDELVKKEGGYLAFKEWDWNRSSAPSLLFLMEKDKRKFKAIFWHFSDPMWESMPFTDVTHREWNW